MTCLLRLLPSPSHCAAPMLLALLLSLPALAADPLSQPAVTTIDLSREALPPINPSIPEQSLRIGNASFQGRFTTDTKSGAITGQVEISWDNGDRFSGRMINGKRQGPGTFEWANGQRYDGDWRDDMPDGNGRQTFASGDRYEGDMKAGTPDGFGVYTDKAGNRYDGQWQAGLKQGSGKYQWANGQSYDGSWEQDHPSGQGELIFANGDRYVGTVQAGLPEGKGSKAFASSGDRYEGEFKGGEAHGSGNYLWKSGDLYQGAWANGRKTGFGRYTWLNGDYWEGNFADDRQMDGRLHFTPNIVVDQIAIEKLILQARAAIDTGSSRSTANDKPLDVVRLSAIPMVALELKICERPDSALDCRQRVLREVETGNQFKHNWQTMFSDNSTSKAPTSYEVDKSSVSELGRVFSWFRFLNAVNGDSRNTGIKYDCRSEALEIQLLYNCTGGAQTATCTLDRNFDKYVGKAIPAATIKGWFKSACERGG